MRRLLVLAVVFVAILAGLWLGGETLLARQLRKAAAQDPGFQIGAVTELRELRRIGVHLTDLRMLAAHVIAAVLTVLVLRRGEALVLTIAERVVAAVCPPPAAHGPLPTPARLRVPVPPVLRPATSLALLSSPGRRGPPFALAA